MRITIKKRDGISRFESLLLWYFAIMICVYNNCFLKWDSYHHASISMMVKLLYHTVCALMLLYALFFTGSKKVVTIETLASVSIAVILIFHVAFLGGENVCFNVVPMLETIIALIALFLMDDKKMAILMERIIIVFTILVLPSMVYFILYKIGVHIPYTILQSDNPGKAIRNVTYMHFPLGLIIQSPWDISRLAGIFDEAGYVGTMAALLFSVGYRRCKNIWLVLLFLEGMLSLSMAFYAMLVIFIIVRAYVDGAIKAAGIVAILALALVVFVNIPFENYSLRALQSRIDFSSSFFIVDNRTSGTFDVAFESFIKTGGYDLWMGKGGFGAYEKNPMMFGSNSYKCVVYDMGVIGFGIYMTFFAVLLKVRRWSKEYLPFFVVFIASIYQRAYIFNVQMVSIFVLAIVYISMKKTQGHQLGKLNP